MQITHDYQAEYSGEYLKKMEAALGESKALNFKNPPRVSPRSNLTDQELKEITQLSYEILYPHLYQFIPGYWGSSCQILSTHVFAFLAAQGIPADIVVGEVDINGTLEFDAELDNLRQEYQSDEILSGEQPLHAWVSLGGDIIVDAGLPDRMIKNYKFPENHMPSILIGRASDLSKYFRARHQPLIVGTDFLAKTNDLDPLEVLEHYRQLMQPAQ